ncbi:MAG: GNAT family N-acetyltransferase [Trueperaceae bacterium]|nr:GNAT family N-acetyltransferase [Trueperaceae bacterium]
MIVCLRVGEGRRLRAIRLRALADAPDAFATTLDEAETRDPEDWEEQLASLPTFVWREGDADLGMIRSAPHDLDPDAGYLISMWVAPEARGRGVGAALVRFVLAWARGRGLRRLLLDVGTHNAPARRLYERHGFVATGATGSLPPPRTHVREHEMAIDLPHRTPTNDHALALYVLPEILAVCRLPAGTAAPPWLEGEPFTSITRTPHETSVVCRAAVVPQEVRAESGWRALQVSGPLDLALTGVLLSLLRPLEAVGVAVFAVSTFDTDWLLVKDAALDDAVAALIGAGHRIERTSANAQ